MSQEQTRLQQAVKNSFEGYGGVIVIVTCIALFDMIVTWHILLATQTPVYNKVGIVMAYDFQPFLFRLYVTVKALFLSGMALIASHTFVVSD